MKPKRLNVRFLDTLLNQNIESWREASFNKTPVMVGDVTLYIFCISDQIDAIWTSDWYMGTMGANNRLGRGDDYVAIIHDNARWFLSGDLEQFENDLVVLRMCADNNGYVDDYD